MHALLAVAVGPSIAVASLGVFFEKPPWLVHVLLAVAVASMIAVGSGARCGPQGNIVQDSALVGACVAGCR